MFDSPSTRVSPASWMSLGCPPKYPHHVRVSPASCCPWVSPKMSSPIRDNHLRSGDSTSKNLWATLPSVMVVHPHIESITVLMRTLPLMIVAQEEGAARKVLTAAPTDLLSNQSTQPSVQSPLRTAIFASRPAVLASWSAFYLTALGPLLTVCNPPLGRRSSPHGPRSTSRPSVLSSRSAIHL